MDLVVMLSKVTSLDKYNHVTEFTNILCESEGLDLKSNNISTLRVLENLHLMEIEYFYNYRKKGAVIILLERLAEIEPSRRWNHINKPMIRILRQWLTASTDLILKDGWMFVKHVMNIIYKINKKYINILHLCEPIIVLILNSHLNYNQKHELAECLNHISNNLTRNQRSLVRPNLVKHLPDIAAMIGPCGHFPCQYGLLEILIRWLLGRNNREARREAANVWFPANRFSTRAKQIFIERTWDNFPKDARDFLNAVNHDEKSVISVQIRKVKMGDEVIIRSAWWWLDINMSTRSVSMMVPRKKLPLIHEPAESHSVAFSLYADDTDNVTLQRIGNQNIVTMSSIDSIHLLPMQKTTAWKTMTVSVTRQYVEILDNSLKQIFGHKYKALIYIDQGIYPSEGETTNYYTESDFSRFSDPEKQNSNFAALKKLSTPNYSSERVFSHTKPIETVVKNTEAQIMSNIDKKILGESNQAKSEATVGSQNDFNETKFDKLLRVTVMCENIDDVRKRDTPSLTLPNSVIQLLSPLDNTLIRKDSKNLGIQGKFDSKTVEAFFERNFTESNLKGRQVTINETPSDDSLPQNEKHDVNTENITETHHCSNDDVNIDINKSTTQQSEKSHITLRKESKSTLRKYFNKKNITNVNTDKLGAIANESIKLKDKEEETSVSKDKPKILKKNSVYKTIKKDKPSLESKHLSRKHVSLKPKDRLFDSLIEKNVSVNDHDENIDVYKFSLLTKREKLRRSPAKYKNKGKECNIIAEGAKGGDNEISKTTEKRNTKASTNLRDEIMRGASAVQLKDSELVKVDTADKIDEPEPASVKDSHMEIIAENVVRENEKESMRMPKENDVDALSVHDSSSSLTLKTIVTSSTIKALDKTYEPRNLESEYLKPRQRDLLKDLLSTIDHQENKCYEQKRTGVLNTKAKELAGTKNLELRVSVERMSLKNISRESNYTKTANLKSNKEVITYKKPLTKVKSTPVPSVCLEKLSSEKIARILSVSCHNSIRENPESNRNSKVGAKEITLEARVTIERSLIIENKVAHNKKRKLETPASERPLVENTAQNKNRELVTPARSPNRKFLKNNCGRRLASSRESSVSEWINEVDPRPKVPLSQHIIDDMKKIVLERIDTTLDEIQRGHTQRTLNMCGDMDKKLHEVFEKQCNVNAQTMDDLGKHICDLLKREYHRATGRWREAFNDLHNELKTNSQMLENDVNRRVEFMTLLREEIDNM